MEKGLKKDLQAITSTSLIPTCFLFVADRESYLSMGGHREGNRGPKLKWYVELPAFDNIPTYSADTTLAAGDRILLRVSGSNIERVVCALWNPTHAFTWVDGSPTW